MAKRWKSSWPKQRREAPFTAGPGRRDGARNKQSPIVRGTVLQVLVNHLPEGRKPSEDLWPRHAGPGGLGARVARSLTHPYRSASGRPNPVPARDRRADGASFPFTVSSPRTPLRISRSPRPRPPLCQRTTWSGNPNATGIRRTYSLTPTASGGRRSSPEAPIVRTAPPPVLLFLNDTQPTHTRRAQPQDLQAVRALHDRCSAATLRARYLGAPDQMSAASWQKLTAPSRASCWLTTTPDSEEVIAMCNLVAYLEDPMRFDLGLLIQDGYQRQGLGGQLMDLALRHSRTMGGRELTATTSGTNRAMQKLLQRAGTTTWQWDCGAVEATMLLTPRRKSSAAGSGASSQTP